MREGSGANCVTYSRVNQYSRLQNITRSTGGEGYTAPSKRILLKDFSDFC